MLPFGIEPTSQMRAVRSSDAVTMRVPSLTDILSKLLGLSESEIDGLYAQEVVHRTESFTSPQVGAVHP